MFDALQRKSLPDLEAVFAGEQSELQTLLVTLVNLHGGVDVLDRARDSLSGIPDAQSALDQLEQVVATVAASHPDVAVYIDLAELRGFRYHTGLVFAAYLEGFGAAVAKGGRYDNCLLYTSPSPRDKRQSRMPSSA